MIFFHFVPCTDPDSKHFDQLVDDFVEIYAFYIEAIGVDGLRIDTVKHVQGEFWDAFAERLRANLSRASKSYSCLVRYMMASRKYWEIYHRTDWPIIKIHL